LYEVDQRRSYDIDVILILQYGGYSVANLLPVSGLATSNIPEGLKPPVHYISTRYLNALSRCYYLRFL